MPAVSARGSCSVKCTFHPRFFFQFFVFYFWASSLYVGFLSDASEPKAMALFWRFRRRIWPSYDVRLCQLIWVAKIISFRCWVSLSWRLRDGSFNILPECEGAWQHCFLAHTEGSSLGFLLRVCSGLFRLDFFERGCWAGRSLGCSSNSSVGCSIGRVCGSGFSSDVR